MPTTEEKSDKQAVTSRHIIGTVERQRTFFQQGGTRSYDARRSCLEQFKSALQRYEGDIRAALQQDLGKPEFESYLLETGFCLHELSKTLGRLNQWMKPRRVRTSLLAQPGSSRIVYSPLGVNLIIAPFNYPINLAFSPMTAAIAAGNTVVLKTSELTPACSEVIQELVENSFSPEYIAYVPGEVEETTVLLQQKFDHIFFTGSPRVGSIVMAAAAKQLTPVTLELGGKSPCIVHRDADLDVAVKRIVRGKFFNAGQTCIAPDYVLVHREAKEPFLNKMKERIIAVYGEDAAASPDFGRMVNDGHFQRVAGLIDRAKVIIGGDVDPESRFIAPTVLRDVTLDDKVMSEEIFGPVLPVLDYQALSEVYDVVARLPQHPLALYLFSDSKVIQDELISNIQFGGGCINNCFMHIANSYLPFGGVGESGIGAYHGFAGFERFSHQKGVLKSPTVFDLPLLYPPYRGKLGWLRKFVR
jgi:aldehyde dehydrogenase (NAD+)